MRVGEIVNILNAKLLTGAEDQSREVEYAFSSDLMSDVLTRDYHQTLLVTGLANLQSIRTAEMSDIQVIVIARGKDVSEEMVALAEESDIVLLRSEYSLFRISGLLYEAGIKPIF